MEKRRKTSYRSFQNLRFGNLKTFLNRKDERGNSCRIIPIEMGGARYLTILRNFIEVIKSAANGVKTILTLLCIRREEGLKAPPPLPYNVLL